MIAASSENANTSPSKGQWSKHKAHEWYNKLPWLTGANFIPSTAINQLEFWQAETYDRATINRELGFAERAGMNVMRVFLHYLLWEQDAEGLSHRIEDYLSISDRHHIKTMFVLFDDSWNAEVYSGIQPKVKQGVHNSGWLQCPGKALHDDPSKWGILEHYTKGIINRFRTDERILLWDVYNEPGNSGYGDSTLPLLKEIVGWARTADPQQPVSIGLWDDNVVLNDFFSSNSDVITFHSYHDADTFRREIELLENFDRPMICTEFMARTKNSTFSTHLPILKEKNAGGISWGLVSGKTNTIYPYLSPEGTPVPELWFHDIFHDDGTAFDPREILLFRQLRGA